MMLSTGPRRVEAIGGTPPNALGPVRETRARYLQATGGPWCIIHAFRADRTHSEMEPLHDRYEAAARGKILLDDVGSGLIRTWPTDGPAGLVRTALRSEVLGRESGGVEGAASTSKLFGLAGLMVTSGAAPDATGTTARVSEHQA